MLKPPIGSLFLEKVTHLNFKRETCQDKKKVSEWINSIAPSPFDNYSERVTQIPGSFACLLIRTPLNYTENGHLSVFPSQKMSYIVNPALWTPVTVTHCLFPCHNRELSFFWGGGGGVIRLFYWKKKKEKKRKTQYSVTSLIL